MAILQAAFDNDPRARVSLTGPEDILAIAAEIRGKLGPPLPEAAFLTETEIAAIRNSFNVPRVTEGLMRQP